VKIYLMAALLGAAVACVSPAASARVNLNIGIGLPGLYAPPPVVYAPQPVYGPPPVVYGAPYYGGGWRGRGPRRGRGYGRGGYRHRR
jgi:hypothetical protein